MANAFNKYYCDKHIMFLCVSGNTAFSYISLSLSVFPLLVYLSSLQLQTCCKILSLSLLHTHTHTHTHTCVSYSITCGANVCTYVCLGRGMSQHHLMCAP